VRLPENIVTQVRYDAGNGYRWSRANIHTRPIPVSPPVIAATLPSSSLNEAILFRKRPAAFPVLLWPRCRPNRLYGNVNTSGFLTSNLDMMISPAASDRV
jgi:hypothetical protein